MEDWLPVPGYEGLYDVSDLGRVRSIDRLVPRDSGGRMRIQRGRILKQGMRGRYQCVTLCLDGKTERFSVHRLVLLAFRGECPPGMEACHHDDDPLNNRLDNLRWDTKSANSLDRIRNGNFELRGSPAVNAAKTHCHRGHEFTEANTRLTRNGGRVCRRCHADSTLAAYHASARRDARAAA